jgi:quinol monooxygenase YgiN
MLKVVAQFFFRNGEVDKALALARALVVETVKEQGCISYELCQSTEKDTHVAFIEEWESQAALDAHFKTPHFVDLVPKIQALTERDLVINTFNKVA